MRGHAIARRLLVGGSGRAEEKRPHYNRNEYQGKPKDASSVGQV